MTMNEMREARHPKRVTLTVSGKLAAPIEDMTLLEKLTWEALFGEHGKYYIFDADDGEAYLIIPKGISSVGADASLDGAWLWYDAGSVADFLNSTWADVLTPDFFRSLCPIPELMTDKVYEAMLDAVKEAK